MAELTLTPEQRLHRSIYWLAEANPELSATKVLLGWQRWAFPAAGLTLVALLIVAPHVTALVLILTLLIASSGAVAFRWATFRAGLRSDAVIRVTDREALALADADLPVYTVLLPAFREPDIEHDVLDGVGRLNYPRDKLDIKLLLEADDDETVQAALAADKLTELVDVELVPPADPRTKPKACNWGLIGAEGEFTTIFDAEDVPEPLQLRRAVVAFRRHPKISCLQARLTYHNDRQNLLTRLFTIEYDAWFTNLLPGLAALRVPLPLGGTSNHLRTAALAQVHGWDPFNVTEDADLGVRLRVLGHESGVLDSYTLEEANSDAINWVKQRSRWHKGYLQTGLVHMRRPRQFVGQLGWRGALGFMALIPGTPLLCALNALTLLMTMVWWLGGPSLLASLYPGWLLYPSIAAALVGNAATIYGHMVVAARGDRPYLAWSCVFLPVYWLLMTMAAVKAMVQLVTNPSYWEKTTHGLHRRPAP